MRVTRETKVEQLKQWLGNKMGGQTIDRRAHGSHVAE